MQKKKVIESEIEKGYFAIGGEFSSRLKKILRRLGVDSQKIRYLAIIAYELEMNLIIHSDGGRISAHISSNVIQIISKDSGPGIKDIKKAFQPGYSTAPAEIKEMGFGAGLGLNNVEKFADNLNIKSEAGKYTILKAAVNLSTQS